MYSFLPEITYAFIVYIEDFEKTTVVLVVFENTLVNCILYFITFTKDRYQPDSLESCFQGLLVKTKVQTF